MGKAKTIQQQAISLLRTAIDDLKRGDRIDALDCIAMVQSKIEESMPHPQQAGVRVAEALFDIEARLATIIYLPAAHDGEDCCESLDEFIEDDIDNPLMVKEIERNWPGFGELVRSRLDEDEVGGGRSMRRAVALELLQHECPKPFLVRYEHTMKSCLIRRKGDRYPLGTWRSGWGFYTGGWLLAANMNEAVKRVIEIAEAQRREAWDEAEAEMLEKAAPVKKRPVAKKRKAVRNG